MGPAVHLGSNPSARLVARGRWAGSGLRKPGVCLRLSHFRTEAPELEEVVKRTATTKTKGKPKGSTEVDAYLAGLTPEYRRALERLRKTIREAAPSAEEGFSYGVPAFRVEGRALIGYSASKDHCSLYPMSGTVILTLARDLEPYHTLKGTIHFSPGKPLPASLVKKLVQARMAEIRKTSK